MSASDKSPSRKETGITSPAFAFGDAVTKIGGDYTFDGEVRAVVVKLSGQIRYVVEDDRGQLHIYRGDQIGSRLPEGDALRVLIEVGPTESACRITVPDGMSFDEASKRVEAAKRAIGAEQADKDRCPFSISTEAR